MASGDPPDRFPDRAFWTLLEAVNHVAFGQAVDRDLIWLPVHQRYGQFSPAGYRQIIAELLAMADGRMVSWPPGSDPAKAYAGRRRALDLLMRLGQPNPRDAAAALQTDLDAAMAKSEDFERAKAIIADRLTSAHPPAIGPYVRRVATIWFRADEVRELRVELAADEARAQAPVEPAADRDALSEWFDRWRRDHPNPAVREVLEAATNARPDQRISRQMVRDLLKSPEGTPRRRGRKPGKPP